MIYKILTQSQWADAKAAGRFDGAPVDHADGFIHFSSAAQLAETAAKHFAGQDGLLLAAVDETKLGEALKWERSRNDDLFPHLYAPLALTDVDWVKPLTLKDGVHQIPAEVSA